MNTFHMKKRFSHFILLLFVLLGCKQIKDINEPKFIHEYYKPISFFVNDTLYNLFVSVNNYGNHSFFDSIEYMFENDDTYMFEGHRKSADIIKVKRTRMEKLDSVYSIFPDYKKYSAPKFYIVGSTEIIENQLGEDLYLSYLLSSLKMKSLTTEYQPTIRFLMPFYNYDRRISQMFQEISYNIYELKLFNNKIMFYKTTGISIDERGFNISFKDSAELEEKDSIKVLGIYNRKQEIFNFNCLGAGDLALVEFWDGDAYNRMRFSYDCINRRENVNDSIGFYFEIKKMGERYFK